MSPRAVPSWVTDGWYGNNPDKQQLAMARYHLPVTTAAERASVREFVISKNITFACTDCGRFAFPQPTVCRWCRQ